MSASPLTDPSSFTNLTSDDRREWIRIDANLLLEYRLLTGPADNPPSTLPPVTQEMIAAAVNKPTADLLARSGEDLADSPLLPWVMKVDWLLEVMLKTLAALHPDCVAIARVTNVNISGGGVSFVAAQEFTAGDQLALKIILPPFTPIHATARVIRSTPNPGGSDHTIATQFQDLSADNHEHIIRHIIHAQAEQLRARRKNGS